MKIIILCGLPGSGKSTICKQHYSNYYRISQDELGNKDEVIKVYINALQTDKDIIVDRTNISRRQRKVFIDLALQYGATNITGIYLSVDPNECFHRINLRKNHPTISFNLSVDKKRSIISKFMKEYEPLSLDEGFTTIVETRN